MTTAVRSASASWIVTPGLSRPMARKKFVDVRTFRSGPALLNGSATDNADCFVIDYKMPNMNGLDLASRLRNRAIAAPIILITGYPDETIPEKAAIAGVSQVLRKPHLEESLIVHIKGVLADGGTPH